MKNQGMNLNRRQAIATGLAAGAAVFWSHPLPAQDAPYRFGLALPLTGPQALYGSDQIQAAQWAVADINKAGGVNGTKLEMIVLDTQADPQVGIQAINRLVNVEKVPVLITAWSVVVKAVAPMINDAKVTGLIVGANSPSIAKLGDYIYTTYPLSDVDIAALAKYLVKQGKKKGAVIFVNTEEGIGAAEIYRTAFKAAGGDIVASETYDPKASDFTGALLKLRSSNPDTVHVQGQVSDAPQLVAQMRQLGMRQTITSFSSIYNPKFIEALGPAAEGVIVTSLAPSAEDSPKVKAYVGRWKSEKGREPNGLPYTQYLYDAPYLIAEVFRQLDKSKTVPTGDTFRKAMLEKKSFELPLTDAVEILPNHTVVRPVYLMVVKNGVWTRLATV
jgi:branched-chain amino acid transport system substrate-binding protein